MKVQDRLKFIARHIKNSHKEFRSYENGGYPRNILDLIIFHEIHFHMDEASAVQSFRRLKANFVDWNEVRISPIPEIQDALGQGSHSLAVAVFIKDLLDFLHHAKQSVDLEFLAEETITDIRRFLRQIKGIHPSTINMVLRVRKEYPTVPVDPRMEPSLLRLGIVRDKHNTDQMGKYLYNLVDGSTALGLHHFFLKHSRDVCPPDEDDIKCPRCGIRNSCHFYQKNRSRSMRSASTRRPVRKK